jgi:3-methyladenine DNA glycosylase AlkD
VPGQVNAVVAQIDAELRARITPGRAEQERAYLHSEREHYGVSVPDVRSVVKQWRRANGLLSHLDLVALAEELWTADVHERKLAAIELLTIDVRVLDADDLGLTEAMIRDSHTWALVDPLAGTVAARIAVHDRRALDVFDRWVGDTDFWVRRSAVLGLREVLRRGEPLDRFEQYADALLDEREFFIRKVLGWVAREVSRRRPEEVDAWVRANLHRMSGITIREAVKYLPDGDALLATWKTR